VDRHNRYSNDIDRSAQGALVGDAGGVKWAGLMKTWVDAMRHPRYLKVNGRPIFNILISEIFVNTECGGNATLANLRISQLKRAAVAAGVGEPIVGTGMTNPSTANAVPAWENQRPHPEGYMQVCNLSLYLWPGVCLAASYTQRLLRSGTRQESTVLVDAPSIPWQSRHSNSAWHYATPRVAARP
jgi:hypothetical protein